MYESANPDMWFPEDTKLQTTDSHPTREVFILPDGLGRDLSGR